jgi:hypothetical protein
MLDTSILSPVLAMVCLTFVVWVWMFITRFKFIGANKIDAQDLATPDQVYRTLPPFAANPGYNFRNLFEVPVLFYVLCFYLVLVGGVDSTHVTCAWIFVALRAVHSCIQCSYNNVNHRFGVYALASISLWVMLARAVFA